MSDSSDLRAELIASGAIRPSNGGASPMRPIGTGLRLDDAGRRSAMRRLAMPDTIAADTFDTFLRPRK